MNPAAVADWVDRLGSARLVVVGDVMVDRFIRGAVERVSPEAPIPVLRVAEEESMVGGAGNTARNATALGARVVLAGVVGDDAAGLELERLARAVGGLDPRFLTVPGRRTTVKTRYFGAAQQLLRADAEDSGPLAAADAERLVAAVKAELSGAGAVVISDYAKGAVGGGISGAIIVAARAVGVPVLVDPKGANFERYRMATVLTPNASELADATGLPVSTEAEAAAAAGEVLKTTAADAVVATRGRRGLSVVRASGAVHLPVRARDVYDVSGAGDTVVAALAAALAVGADVGEGAAFANAAAGVVVGKVGTAVATVDEVLSALFARDRLDAADKIASSVRARDCVLRWRRDGDKIAFTNGCFDLVHPGHVSLLRQARATSDRLVVGLNTDASVRRLKGEGRPIQGEGARAAVLASFTDVDLVVPFGEDTPLRLLDALRPDVLVKGADYTPDTVVGADLVRGYGGRVELAELTPGESSTGLLARIDGRGGSAAR